MGDAQYLLHMVVAADIENKLDASFARIKRDALTNSRYSKKVNHDLSKHSLVTETSMPTFVVLAR
jgi:hypothetical protein